MNDPLKDLVDVQMWRKRNDIIDYTLIGSVVVVMVVLDVVPNHVAKTMVWYCVAYLILLTIVSAIVSRKAYRIFNQYMKEDAKRIEKMTKELGKHVS